MTRPSLTLADLADAMQRHTRPYKELDVFADDVEEIRALLNGEKPESLQPLDSAGSRFAFTKDGRRYIVELTETGVVRFSEGDGDARDWDSVKKELMLKALDAAVRAARSKKGSGWASGLVLGLLVGAVIGTTTHTGHRPPRWVLTMRFDPKSRSWSAYDGGLVGWMKQELQPTG